MPTAPTLVAAVVADSSTSFVASVATGTAVSWAVGDVVSVIGLQAGAATATAYSISTTGTGLAFGTPKQQHLSAGADCGAVLWEAVATAASSGTFTYAITGTTDVLMVTAVVTRNSTGIGNTALVNGTAAHTLSFTPQAADSLIGWAMADWSASAVAAYTPTPTTHTTSTPGPTALPASKLITGDVTYYFGVLDDQTSAGAVSYGTTSASTNQAIVVFEVLGAGGGGTPSGGDLTNFFLRPNFAPAVGPAANFPYPITPPWAFPLTPLDASVLLSGNQYTQALNAGLDFSSANPFTGADGTVNLISDTETGGLSFAGTDDERTSKGLAPAVLSFTGTTQRQVGRLLTLATLTLAGNLTTGKVAIRALIAVLAFTGSSNAQTRTTRTGAVGLTGSLPRAVGHGLGAALSFTGSNVRRISHAVAAVLSLGGTLVTGRAAFRTLTATLSLAGFLVQKKLLNQALTAALSFTGSAVRQTRTLRTAALSFVGTLPRRAAPTLSAVLSFVGTSTARTTRLFNAAVSFTGSFSLSKILKQTLTATVAFVGALPRRISSGQTATLFFVGSLPRRISSGQAATLSFAGSVAKRVLRVLTATLGLTGSFSVAKLLKQSFTAALSFAGSIGRIYGRVLTAAVGFTGQALKRGISHGLTTGLSFTGLTNQRISYHLAAAVSFIGALGRRIPKALSATLSFTGLVVRSRIVFRTLTAAVGFTGSFVRVGGKLLQAGLGLTGGLVNRARPVLRAVLGLVGNLDVKPTLLSVLTNLRIRLGGQEGSGMLVGRRSRTSVNGQEQQPTVIGKENGT